MSARSNASGNMFPLLLMGALGIGIAYYLYSNNESGGIGGGSSAGSSWLFGDEGIGGIGGAATNSDRAMSPAAASAGAASGARSSSSGVSSAYVADVKKSAMLDGNYYSLNQNDISALNNSLAQLYNAEGRSESAFNFVAIPQNATAAATIKNTGISNAGKELLSVVNSDGSYNVYDWRGNIVSSGSAGAASGARSSSGGGSSSGARSSSGGGSSSGAGSSKKAASVSSGSLSSVNITADKASARISSGGGYRSGTISGSVGVSSGGGSSPTSKKYTH